LLSVVFKIERSNSVFIMGVFGCSRIAQILEYYRCFYLWSDPNKKLLIQTVQISCYSTKPVKLCFSECSHFRKREMRKKKLISVFLFIFTHLCGKRNQKERKSLFPFFFWFLTIDQCIVILNFTTLLSFS
jgi:hypothetical protein